jgi:hypothetical protein
MIHAEYNFSLNVSPEEAFNYLANPLNDIHWQSSCDEAELLDPVVKEGSRYQIVFNFLGRSMNFDCQITVRDPHREYAFKVLKGPFHYEGHYGFKPTDDGVDVHWQFAAEPGRFFGILPASILRKVLVSQVERDVVMLKRKLVAPVAA